MHLTAIATSTVGVRTVCCITATIYIIAHIAATTNASGIHHCRTPNIHRHLHFFFPSARIPSRSIRHNPGLLLLLML
uniref:Putative secreted protein n=1 Tax=Anopheles darlingi TaxID=43151 RepID=A0A2M4DNR3_ANODA